VDGPAAWLQVVEVPRQALGYPSISQFICSTQER
jgi:hypothetical protein